MAAEWNANRFPEFRELCASVLASEMNRDTLPILNWYEAISNAAGVWWHAVSA